MTQRIRSNSIFFDCGLVFHINFSKRYRGLTYRQIRKQLSGITRSQQNEVIRYLREIGCLIG